MDDFDLYKHADDYSYYSLPADLCIQHVCKRSNECYEAGSMVNAKRIQFEFL